MASKAMKKKMQVYNAPGSEAVKAAEDETGDFKKGGRTKKRMAHKDGGKVEGHEAKDRKDRPRHKRAAGGRTPYSSGRSMSTPPGATDSGHENQRPS